MPFLLNFKSIFAGLLVTMLMGLGLIGLGSAFELISFEQGLLEGPWIIVLSSFSLLLGSYFATRFSGFKSLKIGAGEGIVIASLALGVLIFQGLRPYLSEPVEREEEVMEVAESPEDVALTHLRSLPLKSDFNKASQELSKRVESGDLERAKTYLMQESGISWREADERIKVLRDELETPLVAQMQMEESMDEMWIPGQNIFFIVLFGSLSAILGGILAVFMNRRKPLVATWPHIKSEM